MKRLALMGFALGSAAPTTMGSFHAAIEAATQRTVKLYGLGAGEQVGYGSGVLISEEGQVLTVLSLLIDAKRLKAVTPDGRRYEAVVLYRDPPRQLALLQLTPAPPPSSGVGGDVPDGPLAKVGPFAYFELQDGTPHGGTPPVPPLGSDAREGLLPGDWVVAAGNAFKVAEGSEPVSVAHGVFSTRTQLDAKRRVREFPYRGDVLVIDAFTSNPGAPGGAVVNLDGRLVGMIGRDVTSNLTHTYFNYAVPRDVLTEFYREAVNNPECQFSTPQGPSDVGSEGAGAAANRDGITLDELSAAQADFGFRLNRAGYKQVLPFVERVRGQSPAARAGLRADDLILSINGKNVADVLEFDERMKGLDPQKPLDLVVRRDRRILNVRIEGR